MKHKLLSILSILLLPLFSYSANFDADDEVTINSVYEGDCYVGAGEVSVLAPIYGDFIVTAGEISIKDSITGDILAFFGTLDIDGVIKDDARIAGGQASVSNDIEGDLIFMGGSLKISESATIHGDLICYGGEVTVYGNVNGNVKIYAGDVKLHGNVLGDVEIKAGKINFNSSVNGNMILGADEIELGSEASCAGNINYWHSDGEMDFTGVCSNVTYDESLAYEEKDVDWSILAAMFGMGLIAYWIIFILSSFVVLLILEHFFSAQFERVSANIKSSFIKSFGYGMLYFIGIPVAIVLCFVTLIGFPLGVLGLFLYLLTFLFATSVIGLAVGHFFKNRSKQTWSYMQTVGYSLLTVVVIKILFSPPVLGGFLKTIAMAAVYGGFLMMLFERKKKGEGA